MAEKHEIDEITVTAEMISAGVDAFDDLSCHTDLFSVVKEIYKRMDAVKNLR